MLSLTIDGRQISVPEGTTVIQAAEKLGTFIPRYCYHPGLSIAGNCRICLVDVENVPKLQIACNLPVTEGMVVHTKNEQAEAGRRAVLEFLLANHPLDCPVCDQSGECDLQNFYMTYGRYQSRFVEDKIKRKKAHPLGANVILDQERCVLCSRCTRFTEEITQTHELGIFNRGNASVIDLYPGQTLDNPYSGNVIDICPVGALTERQFRFKCRVWYLRGQESICNGCARGCNITLHYTGDARDYKAGGRRVQRLKPRFNPEVNRWWICDEGRFGFEFIDENRIEFPYVRGHQQLKPCTWEGALEEASRSLQAAAQQWGPQSIAVLASAQLSNEELFLLKQIFRDHLEVEQIGFRDPAAVGGYQDDFLIRADKNPNSAGAAALGLDADIRPLLQKAADGEIKLLYVIGHDLGDELLELLRQAEFVIYHGTNWNPTAEAADVVLAGATYAEKEGTFTNFEGRTQVFRRAFPPLEEALDDLKILGCLAEKLGISAAGHQAGELFQQWRKITYQQLGQYGAVLDT